MKKFQNFDDFYNKFFIFLHKICLSQNENVTVMTFKVVTYDFYISKSSKYSSIFWFWSTCSWTNAQYAKYIL